MAILVTVIEIITTETVEIQIKIMGKRIDNKVDKISGKIVGTLEIERNSGNEDASRNQETREVSFGSPDSLMQILIVSFFQA